MVKPSVTVFFTFQMDYIISVEENLTQIKMSRRFSVIKK